MVEELESLKMQVKDELIAKTSQLDGEYEELQKERERLRKEAVKAQRDLELHHSQRLASLEQDFLSKLTQLEHSLSTDHSSTLATLCTQLQSQKDA
jgi:hypothetical protein